MKTETIENADGTVTEIGYYDNGQKWYEQTYKDGQKYGLQRGWWRNGNKRYEELWENDIFVKHLMEEKEK